MTQVALNIQIHQDIHDLAIQSNSDVIAFIHGKRMLFSIDLLQGMAMKNMPTDAATILLYCEKYGLDDEYAGQDPQFMLCAKNDKIAIW